MEVLPFASLVRHCWKQNPPAPPYPPTYTWTSAPTSQPRSCLNNEVTSAAWLQPRHKESIVSITMRKNEGPLLMRRMWCPCHPLLQPRNPQQRFPPPAPCHTHLTTTLPPSTAHHSLSLCHPIWGKTKPLIQTHLPFSPAATSSPAFVCRSCM